MKKTCTPLTIRLMLACYTTPEPAELIGDQWHTHVATEARCWLHENDLIDENFRVTSRGRVWAEQICSTPLPVQKWLPGERAA